MFQFSDEKTIWVGPRELRGPARVLVPHLELEHLARVVHQELRHEVLPLGVEAA